jgi:hypothetical protein
MSAAPGYLAGRLLLRRAAASLLWMAAVTVTLGMPAFATDLTAAADAFADDLAKVKDLAKDLAKAQGLEAPGAASVLGGWRGNDSKVAKYAIERVTDAAAWGALWARHAPGEMPPPVDFSAAMVVAVFTGSVRISVIPSINLANVVEHDAIDVTVDNYVNDIIDDERANLYVFVVLRRSSKPVRVIGRSFCIMCQPQETVQVLEEFKAIPENQ